jgi:hypothetical protein
MFVLPEYISRNHVYPMLFINPAVDTLLFNLSNILGGKDKRQEEVCLERLRQMESSWREMKSEVPVPFRKSVLEGMSEKMAQDRGEMEKLGGFFRVCRDVQELVIIVDGRGKWEKGEESKMEKEIRRVYCRNTGRKKWDVRQKFVIM